VSKEEVRSKIPKEVERRSSEMRNFSSRDSSFDRVRLVAVEKETRWTNEVGYAGDRSRLNGIAPDGILVWLWVYCAGRREPDPHDPTEGMNQAS